SFGPPDREAPAGRNPWRKALARGGAAFLVRQYGVDRALDIVAVNPNIAQHLVAQAMQLADGLQALIAAPKQAGKAPPQGGARRAVAAKSEGLGHGHLLQIYLVIRFVLGTKIGRLVAPFKRVVLDS